LPTSGSKEDLTLAEDIPDHGLQAGDLGTVVEVYAGGGVEVEFVTGSGATQALLTLSERDIRKVDPHCQKVAGSNPLSPTYVYL
jgi:hypothetical protein